MRATQAGHGPIVFAWEAEQRPTARTHYLQSLAQTAARATTQPVVTAPPPASKPAARKAHQPIIGTIKLRQGNGKTETLQVIGNDAPQRGQLRAPQFGVRSKTHG